MAPINVILISFTITLLFIGVTCFSTRSRIAPVEVDVYYESLCPDSKRFFQRQLWPVYKNIGDDINLKLIPYGNAHYTGSPDYWSFTCQHGPSECRGNMIQTCAIETTNSTMDSLKFIVCAFNTARQEKSIDECIRDKELQAKVTQCADGPMGKNLEYQMALLTDNLNPPQNFIPWITINKQGSQTINNKANNDLFSLICDSYQGVKPSECSKSRGNNKITNPYEQRIYL